MPTRLALALLPGLLFTSACSSAPTEPTETFGGSPTALSVDVTMPGEVFRPNNIDIAEGGVVRFVFSALTHDVRFNAAASAPADILAASNATVTRTFSTAGSFPFLCTLHDNMTGIVVVH